MGRASGNGMGSAFRVYWPSGPSKRTIDADLKRLRELEDEAAEADREVQRLERLARPLAKLIQEARATGLTSLGILKALAKEIRFYERRDRAHEVSEK